MLLVILTVHQPMSTCRLFHGVGHHGHTHAVRLHPLSPSVPAWVDEHGNTRVHPRATTTLINRPLMKTPPKTLSSSPASAQWLLDEAKGHWPVGQRAMTEDAEPPHPLTIDSGSYSKHITVEALLNRMLKKVGYS